MADGSVGQPITAEAKAPDLEALRQMFESYFDMTSDARAQSVLDIDYFDGDQWTAAERAALKARKQPDNVFNRIRTAVNGIIGVTERGRSDPRAYPRTPKDEESADVATDTLRFIGEFNRFHAIKRACFKDMLVPGTMAALIGCDAELQVTIEQIRWEDFFHDPRSRREDFKDARFMGIAKWMYAADVKALYPDKADEIENAANAGNRSPIGDSTNDDRPDGSAKVWNDRRSRRVRVVELYHQEAGWQRCVFLGDCLLDYGESPYLDDKGKPCNPIEAQSAYVNRKNGRYGVVRDMRGPQDEINKRRSKLLWEVSASQIQANDPSAIEVDPNTARAEAARPDGVLPFGWEIVNRSDKAAGQFQLLQESKAEIERLGPNPAVVGRDNADASGRALQARTQAGLIELAPVYGGVEDWELRVYRQCWSRARQFWKEPQYIRVTDDEDAPKFIGLNQPKGKPIVQPEVVQHPETGQPVQNPQAGQPVMDPKTGAPAEGPPEIDPMTGKSVFGYKNTVAEMDVDIILDTQPDTANIQQEQFQDLVQLVGSNPAYAQTVPFEIMIELSAVPHKRQMLDKLKKAREQAMQGQEEQQALAKANAEAEVRKTQSEAGRNEAQAQAALAKAQRDASGAQVDQAGAENDHALTVLKGIDLGHQHAQPAAGDTGASGSQPPQR